MNNIKAKKRENTASGFTNNLRKQGLIPAILYGGKNPNQNISVEKKSIYKIINSESFLSKVLELDIEGKKKKFCQEMLRIMLFLMNRSTLIL